jgi:hypothetical protein
VIPRKDQDEIATTVASIKHELSKRSVPIADTLRNRFVGVPAFVVSAGPSAVHWKSVYDQMPKPNLVVCVKQSIELEGLDEICHLHFCNSWNLKRYSYDRASVLRIFSPAATDPPSLQSWELLLEIEQFDAKLSSTLASTCAFDDWTIEKTGTLRPWGPGIMYESVFFLLLHLGVTSISTVGWDIGDANGTNTHFYDSVPVLADNSKRRLVSRICKAGLKKSGAHHINRLYRFWSGQKYNIAGTEPGEVDLVASSVPKLGEWLARNGVRLECYTNSEWISEYARPLPTKKIASCE